MTRFRAAAVVLAALLSAVAAQAVAAPARPPRPHPHKQRAVCARTPDAVAHCDSHVQTHDDGVTPAASTSPAAGSYGPADLQSAYKLPAATGQTVAIVDAYDEPNVESDLAAYRSHYGLPACSSSTGCFRKVNQSGATSPLPSPNAGWGQEIALDVEMVSATCPSCRIVLVEANSASFGNLGTAENTAARMANAISNSWGGSEFSGETSYDGYFNHPGVAITVSSGDSGYGVEYPASSSYVTGVGGTHLTRSSTTRGWTETAWTGAGSGCSRYVAKPSWQTDTGCARRTVADVSAVADPNTGVAVYDSYGSSGGNNWYVFGGTSVASPIIAATYALGGATSTVNNASVLYSHRTSLFDVLSGSNGTCSPSYLCTAVSGFDGPTGLGTPNGTVAFGGSSSTTTTTSTTSSSTTSSSTTSTTKPTTTTTTAPTTTTTLAGGQLVLNGGFETGAFSPWLAGGGAPTPVLVAGAGHTGSYSARLGTPSGTEPYGDSWVYQTVTVPSSATKATLSFWYWPATTDSVTYDWQQAQIRNTSGATLAQIFKIASNAQRWTLQTVDVTAYRGQTIQLWFDVHQDGYGDITEMYLDDTTLTWS